MNLEIDAGVGSFCGVQYHVLQG